MKSLKATLKLGSSSNRYAPRLPQQETKSSTKQLAPTDPILGPEKLLKTGFAQKGLPSTTQHLPTSLVRLFSEETLSHLNVTSCLISAILAVLLIATAPEEFGIPECTTTVEAAGLDGPHRWGIILPNSSRVSPTDVQSHCSRQVPGTGIA